MFFCVCGYKNNRCQQQPETKKQCDYWTFWSEFFSKHGNKTVLIPPAPMKYMKWIFFQTGWQSNPLSQYIYRLFYIISHFLVFNEWWFHIGYGTCSYPYFIYKVNQIQLVFGNQCFLVVVSLLCNHAYEVTVSPSLVASQLTWD